MRRSLPFLLVAVRVLAQDPLAEGRRALKDFDFAAAATFGAKALEQSAESPAVHTFLGDVHLDEGRIADAEKEFKTALKFDERFVPAWYGLSQVFRLASLNHRAELTLWQALQYEPDNTACGEALAELRWPRENPDKEKLTSSYGAAEIPLALLMEDSKRFRGFTIQVSINGGKPLRLMLDTGAGGIFIRTKAAERVGLQKIAETKVAGIGDKGKRDAWISEAEQVQIGSVSFSNYPIEVADKDTLSDADDGLIGADVFSDFLVHIDFFRHKLVLEPRPGGPPDRTRTFDRTMTPGFSPIFRLGHALFIPTKVNDAGPFLFMVDTGSSTSLIARNVAKLATKVHTDSDTIMKGISGKVNEVYSADELTLQFANFRQRNTDMITFDLDGISRQHGMEVGGILGFRLLVLFRSITIDYANGLVKFEYKDR